MNEPTARQRTRRTAYDRKFRAERIFARLLEGQSYLDIAEAEKLSVRRVRMMVQEALDRWDIEPKKEYALVQIARLDGALRLVEQKIAEGKLHAIPHLIKLLDQLSRYHGPELYNPPMDCLDEQRGAAVRLKLERLAASRMAVASRGRRRKKAYQGRKIPAKPLIFLVSRKFQRARAARYQGLSRCRRADLRAFSSLSVRFGRHGAAFHN